MEETTFQKSSDPKLINIDQNTNMQYKAFKIQPIWVSSRIMHADFCYLMVHRSITLGVERLVAAYQAAPSVNRVGRPSSLSFLFTEIMNDGAFRGTLRGLSMNFLQASLVLWPAALVTNRGKNGFLEFMVTFSALDALLHPLDTVKNKMYANTVLPLSNKYIIQS